jgi:hypothetical protein
MIGSREPDVLSALVQLGLRHLANLPVAGAEAARKMLDHAAGPSNLLMKRPMLTSCYDNLELSFRRSPE